MAVVQARRCILEVDGTDARRQRSRCAFRIARTACHGRRSHAAVSRVGGRGRDPQGGAAGKPGGQVSLLQHGVRCGRLLPRRVETFCRGLRSLRVGRQSRRQDQARSGYERPGDSNGRRDEICGAERESGLYRRRLHHRAGAGSAELFGRRPGMGTHGPVADLPARTAAPVVSPRRRRRGGGLDRHGGPSLALHRAADCGRRDARWSRVHTLSDAQESFRRAEARIRGIPLGAGVASIGRAD